MDKHIRRLDADLARFENELKEKLEVSYDSTDGRGLKSKLSDCTPLIINATKFESFKCVIMQIFSPENDVRGLREKRGSRGRGRKGSDEDSPRKKKMKNRYV